MKMTDPIKTVAVAFAVLVAALLPVNRGRVRAEENPCKTVVISGIQNEQTHLVAREVLQAAYRRIGYDARFVFLPARRSLKSANSGVTDGDIARIPGTEKAFSNLLPVPIPVIHFKGVAFGRDVDRTISEWKDLAGLRIGVIRGIRYSTIGTTGCQALFAEDMTHLFRLLESGRIQVAVAVLEAGRIEIQKHFPGSGIRIVSPPLYSGPLYHFVHRKRSFLVADLNRVLAAMEDRGEIESITARTWKRLLLK